MALPTAELLIGTPRVLHAGLTWAWLVSAPNYLPADGWTVKFALSDGTNQIAITTSDNGDGVHLVNVAAATTAAYTAGTYHYIAYAESGSDKGRIEEGEIRVVPDPIAAAGDLRSDARKMLDALEATLLGKASKDQQSYTIATGNGSRSLARLSPEELLRWRDHYAALVRNERSAADRRSRRASRNVVHPRFVR